MRSSSPEARPAPGDRVLVISNRDDVHARAVLSRLEAVSGVEHAAVLFDTATFPMASDVAVASEWPSALGVYPALPEVYGGATRSVLREAGPAARAPLPLERVRSVYWRRPRVSIIDDVLAHPDLRQYAAKSSRETIEGVVERLALDCPVVDAPGVVARASLKVLQLELARRVGLHVPRTLVTNSPDAAMEFIGALQRSGAEVISKSPADLHHLPAQTELVDDRKTSRIDRVRLSPTILQERIAGGPDLRITVVGERLFGMAQPTRPGYDVDSRIDPAPQREPFEPSASLRAGILALQQRFGLSFGAYDFKCDGAGTPYFLEVNPSGQWLFAETATQHPIAEALARHLWEGPGAEWRTSLPPIREDDLEALFPFSIADEYAALWRTVEAQAGRPA